MAVTGYSAAGDISSPLMAYEEHQRALALCVAVHGGTATMRKAKTTYLPQEDGETPKSYENRLKRSVLTNYYKRTLEKLAGQAFEEDIAVDEKVDPAIVELFNDIDLEGNNLDLFMRAALMMAIHKGVAHIMVEYPEVAGAKTVEDHKRAKARPYWILIDPDNVIGWRFETIDGKKTLVQLRIKETVTMKDGLYGVKEEERIRLYEPGKWSILVEGENGWAVKENKETGQPMEGTTSLGYIPLATLMLGERLSDMTATSCLSDLAELNCVHWQSASDQRNILHYARLITYFGKMLEVDAGGKVKFGANKLIHSTSPEGDLKVVEHSGAGIEAGRNDLKDLELAMALFGLTMMLPKVTGVTATENSIDKGESDSALTAWVKTMGSMLETLHRFTCEWIRKEPTGTLVPFSAFTSPFGAGDGALIVEAYKAGLMPQEMALTELKERGLITSDIDMIEITTMIEKEAKTSTLMRPGLMPPEGNPGTASPRPGASGSKAGTLQ